MTGIFETGLQAIYNYLGKNNQMKEGVKEMFLKLGYE